MKRTGREALKTKGEGRRIGNMELLLFQAAKQGSTAELGYVLELPEGMCVRVQCSSSNPIACNSI